MKTRCVFFAFIILSGLSACRKEERQPNPTSQNNQLENPDWWVMVRDTSQLIIGDTTMLEHVVLGEYLDISGTAEQTDFSEYVVPIKNAAFKIKVSRDTLRTSDGKLLTLKGIFFTELDSAVRVGFRCADSKYAYSNSDVLSYLTLCDYCYDTSAFFMGSLVGMETAIYFDIDQTESTSPIKVRSWNESVENEGMGQGYLCFRFYDAGLVKYGWLKMDILSNQRLKILEYAYQK